MATQSYFPFQFPSTCSPQPVSQPSTNALWLLSSTAIENFNLKALLNSVQGSEIVSYYENENVLNAFIRKRLINLVVDYFVTNRIKIGTKDCNLLADKIIEIFPTENKDDYFIAARGNTNAKGALYTKYNNQLRFYRTKGLIDAAPKRPISTVQRQNMDVNIEPYSDQDSTSRSTSIELKSEVCDIEDFQL